MKSTLKFTISLSALLLLAPSLEAVAQTTVTLTSPFSGTVHTPGSNVTLSATATAASGYTISKVEFFRDTTLVATDTTAPYSVIWSNVPQGNYPITAKVTAIKKNQPNQTATSPVANIIVTVRPAVTLTAPTNGAIFGEGANITLNANASDSDGAVARVEFWSIDQWSSQNLLASISQPPYTFTWSNVGSQIHETSGSVVPWSVFARVIDNQGATNSAGAEVTVNPDPPVVALTSPANNATFSAPANITLAATASDPNGAITRVEFYNGNTLITTANAAPYTFIWSAVPAGSYVLTARAVDNTGTPTDSSPVNVTVNTALSQLYFVHVDHLNTPRLVANQSGQTVWRWDQQEPFGVNVPDENPSALGIFDLPLRLPGQYFDEETGLHYNYFRDYDPSLGSYKQFDPIGLRGSMNGYGYVAGKPLGFADPFGLAPTGNLCLLGQNPQCVDCMTSGLLACATQAVVICVPVCILVRHVG